MRRILFVDDEPKILEGLQRMLRPHRQRWEMAFASSGEAALTQLEAAPFDVIVSDMRMPGMDGAALLTRVRDRFPNVVRMVLTGYTSLETALRSVPVAHQFLVKPCDPNVLQVAVERACSLKTLLSSELLCHTVGAIQDLPALPRTYAALTQALADPDVSMERVAKIVEQDVAISAKILQLVNSPLFGLMKQISTVKMAVSYLGMDILKNLVLSVEVFRAFEGTPQIVGVSFQQLHAHAYLTARIAARLPTEGNLRDAAHVGALLHDVGKLVLMKKLPDHFARVMAVVQEHRCPMHTVEQELVGVTHAEIGAYLLGLWGLPYPIVESVAYHHFPSSVPQHGFDPLATVYVANILAHESATSSEGVPQVYAEIDPAYLAALGVNDQLPVWRSAAAEVAASLAEV